MWYQNGSTLNIKQNLKKMTSFFRSEIGIFEIFFKSLCKESFEDLKYNRNWEFQTRAAMSHKMGGLKSFCKITQKSPFNSQYS